MCTAGYCTVLLLSLLYSFHVRIGLTVLRTPLCCKYTKLALLYWLSMLVSCNISNFQFGFMLISVFLLRKKQWRYSQSKIDKISAHLLLPFLKGRGANIACQCIPPHKKALLFIHITAQIAKCLTEKEPEGLSRSRDC